MGKKGDLRIVDGSCNRVTLGSPMMRWGVLRFNTAHTYRSSGFIMPPRCTCAIKPDARSVLIRLALLYGPSRENQSLPDCGQLLKLLCDRSLE